MTIIEILNLKPFDTIWYINELDMKIEKAYVIEVTVTSAESEFQIKYLTNRCKIHLNRYNDGINSFTLFKKAHQIFKTKEELLSKLIS